jgi:hypothetical protein
MKLAVLATVAVLAFSQGCDRLLTPARPRVYAAWEEGLTLGFENPQQADATARAATRQMVRVKEAKASAGGMIVTKTFTSFSGQWETRVLQNAGGVRLLTDAPGGILMLPEGFPDQVSRWSARGTYNWVVGRAAADLPGVRFADPGAAVGVWVESTAAGDPAQRTRTLFLPDLGEVETLTWNQGQGRWDCTNQLVTRGFTDLPAAMTAPSSGSTQ